MDLEDKARQYAEGKSSASVFRDAHIRDFKAGYNQALKDTRFDDMLEMLKDIVEQENVSQSAHDAIYDLIKQTTEL